MSGTPPAEHGRAEEVAPGIRRVLAPNPSPMTLHGTNSYILGRGAVAVIDPGPALPGHLEALLASLEPGERVSHILVTHAHVDHSPLARSLSDRTEAPVYGFGPAHAGRSEVMSDLAASGHAGGGEGIDPDFAPDVRLEDGAVIEGDDWQVQAIWTPGHLSNHMCFDAGTGLFCGDHVMGWASSLVSPPDGDLSAFMASCARLLTRTEGRQETPFLSGHGDPIIAPAARLDWLMAHRRGREAEILAALETLGPATPEDLARAIYTDVAPALLPAAARNVFAHLIDLTSRGQTAPEGPIAASARFALT